ncbi:MAG TPA: hypothetical protein VEB21_08925, partial [Terriglobales bacterium]|nr:hypothetical protein [Terriglobales bacterium]
MLYRFAHRWLSWWPIGARRRRAGALAPLRIGYYYHAFPVPSETFIVREIGALERIAIAVEVFAHRPPDPENLGPEARRRIATTTYIDPIDPQRLRGYRRRFLRRRPLTVANLFLYNAVRSHRPHSKPIHDRELFDRAVYLAGLLQDRGITHVHVPWAKADAAIAMMAARLIDIPYTVQARASDLHRDTSQIGLRERLRNADCVVTNAEFNRPVIASLLADDVRGRQ